MTSLEKLIKIL